MDVERHFKKTYLNLIPPPPKSLAKLPDEEIKEITDYIFEHAKQTHRLIKEDAERTNENWKEYCFVLARSSVFVIVVLLAVIAYLIWKLNS